MKLIAILGPLKGLVVNLDEKDDWILGRDSDQCNFALEDTTISRKHAKITKTDEGYLLKNLSHTNPLEVNDDRVDDYILQENDKIKLGDNIFLYTKEPIKNIEKSYLKEEEPIEEEFKIEKEKPEEEFVYPQEDETIFEDTQEPTALSLLIDAPFILKVIAGSNAGSEFGMEKNKSYIIGKDTALSDIIFTDLSVSKENTKITIDENSDVFVEDLNSKNGTYVNNKKIDQKTKITSKDIVTIGTTTFLVLEKEAAEETIYSPAPTFATEEEKEKIKEEKKEKEKLSWKKQFIPTKHIIAAGSLVVIVFVVFLSFFALFKAKTVEVAKTEPIKKIETALKTYSDIEYNFNPSSNSLFLMGHVLNTIDKQEMMYDLDDLYFIKKIDDNVVVDELVTTEFNESLNKEISLNNVYCFANKPGNFILSGYVATTDNYSSLITFVNDNFPYTDKLENKVVITQVLQTLIANKLMQYGFGSITYQFASGKLILSGRYDKKQAGELKELIEEFLKTNGISSVKNLAISSDAISSRIDLTDKYKITGWAKYDDNQYSVVANGQIIVNGDLLDGMLVTNISDNMILLEKDVIKYKISYSP
jgi:type III secretion system YscD/HrpQ family protein